MESGNPYRFGPFLLDPKKRLLLREEQEVPLYGKAFDTLLVLVRNPDRLVKKEELLREIWADRVVEENNLSQSISATRKALGDTAQPHVYIVTVPGWGYRFAASVSVVEEPIQSQVPVPRPPVQPVVPSSRFGRLVPAALILVTVLLSAGLLRSRFGSTIFAHGRPRTVTAVPMQARRSVAIVGFHNLTGQKDDAWLSTALSEMLHTELAAGEELRVISQEDVARAKAELLLANTDGRAKGMAPTIGRSLGSDLLVSGSYSIVGEKGGKQVRFDLRLQNANSGETVAEIAETGAQTDLFVLVSQAGVRLRQKLGVSELSSTETLVARASLPKDTDATRFYAEGLARLRMFDAIGARDLLQKAIVLDPDYSLAHSALADAWSVLGYDHKSHDEAEKAFQLSGGLSRQDQLSVEGQYRMAIRDWAKAGEVYRTLFSLFPDDLNYGLHLASAQTAASASSDAMATLNLLRRLPHPAGNDPRISLKEYEAWKSLGDFKHMEKTLTEAADTAQTRGALLLAARARTRLCWVQRVIAEPQLAIEDCRKAQQIYAAAGDRRGEAEVFRFLGDVASGSDAPSAMRYYKQSLAIEQEIGHLGGQASVMTQLATQYSHQGDHVTAKNSYEQAEAVFKQLDDKLNATGLMIDVGAELAAQGQIEEATKTYQDAQESASVIGNKYIEALAAYNTGLLRQMVGDLHGAQKSYQQALTWFREVGNKEFDMSVVRGLVEVATLQGDFPGAHKLYEQALAMRQPSQHDVSTAEREMARVQLSLDEDRVPVDAEASLRRVVQVFHDANQANNEALSTALLARCLLMQGRSGEALKAIEYAVEISTRADRNVRLFVKVREARIQFAAEPGRNETRAANELTKAIAEAREFHYFSVELEGRLALGEVEIQSGAITRGRAHLQAVEKDASRRGFVLLARKAKSTA
jgi:DNA-binding winged helix-turn-helix (wHTH) protein/tetratricopeptide (TPR) repeat protein/TolB-like protein